jgi:hypothetical protein
MRESPLDRKAIDDYTDIFDDLWNEAARFKENLFAKLNAQDMGKMGTGCLLKEWSALEV